MHTHNEQANKVSTGNDNSDTQQDNMQKTAVTIVAKGG